MRNALVVSAILAATLLAAPARAQNGPDDGADQVVGLFGATCLHFATDTAGLRGFLNEQKAPHMPQEARDAFLAGRHGEVFDVSYQTTKLALVSLDDGGCEAVAEKADGTQVISLLNQAARENQVTLMPLGAQGKSRPGVQQTGYGLTLAGQGMHILVSTETPPPQVVLTLVPK
jgi:hypothetical protein